jgi:hypothetical protein
MPEEGWGYRDRDKCERKRHTLSMLSETLKYSDFTSTTENGVATYTKYQRKPQIMSHK